ncbi:MULTISPECIES: prephenate dehydrogenase dimerization domain-containing protein [Photorhabdus]|uniref:Prephenate dehydrogenase n=2 Tax=Photorhabdus asymbiotica TaxID=291112 RepID=A0ABX9STK6_9GAMM|nr:prephenate dehydrogenase dimerization domain-containing protein [Photorhabdus asymbiotica]RKS66757.1 prephenate dehydrogenase [Photorhabdus asymbiotica]CAQ83277.1 similar to dehydrogenase papc of streptomyces pristinaespiralis [Photorhabdus asymbiotica]CAR66638.1 similar to dehydrogenase papc of streptomyces pristinaespiralis [Photorhabdus asymbiotica subsp. asymbiotica ATCC 43949]
MSNHKVVILGGQGAIGSLLGRLFTHFGCVVYSVDKRTQGVRSDCYQVDILNPAADSGAVFNEATAVVFALPEAVAVQALPWVLSAVGDDVQIVSTCSVQTPFYSALKAAAPRQPFIGVNPMFSPSLPEQKRPVAVVLDNCHVSEHWIEQVLMQADMRISRMMPEEHDRVMALCQALPHAAILIFGLVLAKSPLDIRTLATVAPPPMRTMLALLSRILRNPIEVYWDVQYENSMAAEPRQELLHAIQQLDSIVQAGDQTEFGDNLRHIAQQLGEQLDISAADCQHIFSTLE